MTCLTRIKRTHLFTTYILILQHLVELRMPRKVVSSYEENDKNILVQNLMDKYSFAEKNKIQREQVEVVEDGKNVDTEERKTTRAVVKRNYSSISSTDVDIKEDISIDHSNQSEVQDKIQNAKQVTEEMLGKKSKWEPSNWHTMLNNIREMRKNMDAPVDNMGCHKCHDDNAPPEVWFS